MTKRLNFEIDQESPLHDERWNRNPPVMDCVALRQSYVEGLVDTATAVGIDGKRIAELFGVEDPKYPAIERGYRIDTYTEQHELCQLLAALMKSVHKEIDSEMPLEDLAYETRSIQQKKLSEADFDLFETYLKARTIRNQLEFALEHDLALFIG